MRVLYLNKKNTLISEDSHAEGTVDHVTVYPREIARRALDLNASAIIVVHNHPSGDPSPSTSDIEMTKLIASVCKVIDVALLDHIIIGKGSEISLFGKTWLEP